MKDDKMMADDARTLAIRGRIEALLGKYAVRQEEVSDKAAKRVRRRIRKFVRRTRKARKAA